MSPEVWGGEENKLLEDKEDVKHSWKERLCQVKQPSASYSS